MIDEHAKALTIDVSATTRADKERLEIMELVLIYPDTPKELIQYAFSIVCGRNRIETSAYLLKRNDVKGVKSILQSKYLHDKKERDSIRQSAIKRSEYDSSLNNSLIKESNSNIKIEKGKVNDKEIDQFAALGYVVFDNKEKDSLAVTAKRLAADKKEKDRLAVIAKGAVEKKEIEVIVRNSVADEIEKDGRAMIAKGSTADKEKKEVMRKELAAQKKEKNALIAVAKDVVDKEEKDRPAVTANKVAADKKDKDRPATAMGIVKKKEKDRLAAIAKGIVADTKEKKVVAKESVAVENDNPVAIVRQSVVDKKDKEILAKKLAADKKEKDLRARIAKGVAEKKEEDRLLVILKGLAAYKKEKDRLAVIDKSEATNKEEDRLAAVAKGIADKKEKDRLLAISKKLAADKKEKDRLATIAKEKNHKIEQDRLAVIAKAIADDKEIHRLATIAEELAVEKEEKNQLARIAKGIAEGKENERLLDKVMREEGHNEEKIRIAATTRDEFHSSTGSVSFMRTAINELKFALDIWQLEGSYMIDNDIIEYLLISLSEVDDLDGEISAAVLEDVIDNLNSFYAIENEEISTIIDKINVHFKVNSPHPYPDVKDNPHEKKNLGNSQDNKKLSSLFQQVGNDLKFVLFSNKLEGVEIVDDELIEYLLTSINEMDHENAKISSKGVEELNEILSSFFSSENCAVLKELGDVLLKANLEKNDIEAVEKVGILRFPPSSFVSEDKRNVGSLINDSENEDNTLEYIEDTENLILMMGDIPRELIQYTYSILCGRNRLETAQYLLENNDLIGIEKIKQLKNVYDKNEKDGAKLSAIHNKKTKSLICNKYGQLLVRPEFNIKGKVGNYIVGLFCYICSFFLCVWLFFLYLCLIGCSLRFTFRE
jgi:hypothetical protein